MNKVFLGIVPFLLFSLICIAQAQQGTWRHYTIDEGLPSNECHDILQDTFGYIWIATDRGLARFDGIEFKNYGIEDGLKDLSVLKIEKGNYNQIWASTNSKGFYVYDPNIDKLKTYAYNSLLATRTPNNPNLPYFYIDKSNTLHFQDGNTGYSFISQEGKFVSPFKEKPFNWVGATSLGGKYLLNSQISVFGHRIIKAKTGQTLATVKLKYNNSYIDTDHKITRVVKSGVKFFHLGGDTLLYIINNGGYVFTKNSYLGMHDLHPDLDDIVDVYVDPKGGIWAAYLLKKGLFFYRSVHDLIHHRGTPYLIGQSCTSILRDSEGGLCVTTLDNGFFRLAPNQDFISINHNLINNQITHFEWLNDTSYVFVVNKSEVYLVKIGSDKPIKIYTAKTYVNDIVYEKKKERLFIIDNPKSVIYDIRNKRYREDFFFRENNVSIYFKKLILMPKEKKYVVLLGDGFRVYNSLDDALLYKSLRKYYQLYTAIPHPKGVLLGGTKGLYLFDGKNTDSLHHIHQVFRSRINTIAKYKSFYLIGTQGYGIAVWNGKEKCFLINKKKGLLSDNIESIHVTEDDEVFVGTYAGLIKLTKKEGEEIIAENFTIQQGLPSNEIFDVDSRDGAIFVSTGRGLARFQQTYNDQEFFTPIIEYVDINKKKYIHGKINRKLNYNENNITIYYKSIHFALQGDILYRYRINQKAWQMTRSNFLNLANVAPGDYVFEVQAANKNGQWSDAATLKFNIKKPWWLSLWFILCILASVAIAAYYFYKNRIQTIKKESKIKEEIRQLQQSALKAQMNPHFIFNCLTAIQNFIMLNQKEDAMDYLSSFARLIRQNLMASAEKFITLAQEIDALKTYIELEQLRYNFRFDYHINIQDKIVPELINIPPLLIQPFVENAIVHGFSGMKTKGELAINFSLMDHNLSVTIRDNGKGIGHDDTVRNLSSEHKSMGISITQKRLDFINKMDDKAYSITRKNLNPGTEIIIKINLG
jgi:signal transduction histidine kinase